MPYTTESFFADIDAKTYINKFREPLYLLGFSENITNHLVGCPDGLGLFYQNFKKFQNVSNY